MNTDLLRATFGRILMEDAQPYGGGWRQGVWAEVPRTALDTAEETTWHDMKQHVVPINACGTRKCFAGWAVSIAHPGAKLLVDDSGEASLVQLPDGTVEFISTRAIKDLELDHSDADSLFSGSNDVDDLHQNLVDLGVFG